VLRAERGLTLREAASLTGVRPGTLSELERGLRHPHDITLSRIATGYGLPVQELLEEPVLSGKAEAPEAGQSPGVETGEAGEPVDYRKLYFELGDRLQEQLDETLAMIDEVLTTEDYEEFVKLPVDEQHWRIEMAKRLNKLAQKILQSIEDEEVELANERDDELAERWRKLGTVTAAVKEFHKTA